MALLDKLKSLWSIENQRSLIARKNIISLFIVRGYGIAINFLLIPLSITLLNDYKYGLWLVLYNVLSWVQIFDIGIGKGLRNRFSDAIAKGQHSKANSLVSTGYIMMGVLTFSITALFIIPWLSLDWAGIFGAYNSMARELFLLVGVAFFFTILQFWLKLISSIYLASHKAVFPSLIIAVANTIIYGLFFFFSDFFKNDLLMVGSVFCIVPAIVYFIFSLYSFNTTFKDYVPALKYFDRTMVRDLFSLGGNFFIIQIAVIVIYQTDALILSNFLDPSYVTPYSIAFRYFGLISMVVGIYLTPFWSAYTEAYAAKDIEWIKSSLKKQLGIFFISILMIAVLYFSAPFLIDLWIDEMVISTSLLRYMAVFSILVVWNSIFSTVLGGLSLIRLGTYLTIFTATINIPLSIYLLENLSMGSKGVILATSICIGITAVISPIQVYYFIFQKRQTAFLTQLLR